MGINPYNWYERGLKIVDINERMNFFKTGQNDIQLRPWAAHGIGFTLLAKNDIDGFRDIIKNVDLIQIKESYIKDWITLGDDLLNHGHYSSALEAYLQALEGDYSEGESLRKFFTLIKMDFPSNNQVLINALIHRPRELKIIFAVLANGQGSLLYTLSKDTDYLVRRAVALNNTIPVEILTSFASDCNPCVKFALLENPLCPSIIRQAINEELRDTILRLYNFDLNLCSIHHSRNEVETSEIWFVKLLSPVESQEGFESHFDGWLSVEFTYSNGHFSYVMPLLYLRSHFGDTLIIRIHNFEKEWVARLFHNLASEHHLNKVFIPDENFESLLFIPKSEQVAYAYEIIQKALMRKKIIEKLYIFGKRQNLFQDKEFVKIIVHSGWKYLFFDCISNQLHPIKKGIYLYSEILEKIEVIRRFVSIPLTEQPQNVDSLQQSYYISVWGFDPLNDWYPGSKGLMRYEEKFNPLSDPNLQQAGIEIYARVEFNPDDRQDIHNRIVFKNVSSLQEGSVDCTHTVIYRDQSEDALGLTDEEFFRNSVITDANTEENNVQLLILTPEEHFVALKSFVASVVEMGVIHLIQESFKSGTDLSFGFNSEMQNQIILALYLVAPHTAIAIVTDFLLDLIDKNSEDWLFSRLPLLKKRFTKIFRISIETLVERTETPTKDFCVKLLNAFDHIK